MPPRKIGKESLLIIKNKILKINTYRLSHRKTHQANRHTKKGGNKNRVFILSYSDICGMFTYRGKGIGDVGGVWGILGAPLYNPVFEQSTNAVKQGRYSIFSAAHLRASNRVNNGILRSHRNKKLTRILLVLIHQHESNRGVSYDIYKSIDNAFTLH